MGLKLDAIVKDLNKECKENIAHKGIGEYSTDKIPFTSPRMNYATYGGLPIGRLIEFYGEEHGGKALVNGTPVLSENGWVAIETLSVGDKVFGEDGELHTVLGVYPQGMKNCYEIQLRDGCSVQCSEDHLWTVFTIHQTKHFYHRKCKPYVKTTKEMLDTIHKEYVLPRISAMKFNSHKELLLDPYLLGLLLGDGSVLGGTPTFTNPEEDLIQQVSEIVKQYNCTLKYNKATQCQHMIVENKKSNNHIINHIFRHYGLLGKHSPEKFIPEDYKFASVEDRLKLVAGLLNTDGHVTGIASFDSTSSKLIVDLWEVCMSLGIQCTYKIYDDGGRILIPYAYIPEELVALLSEKHKKRMKEYEESMQDVPHIYYRKIKNIVEIGERECTCIKVDNPTSLFITKDFIPTHNTTTALDIVKNYQAMEDARDVLWCDCENTLDLEWARKLGVDVESMYVLKPTSQSAEEIFQFILEAVDTGEVGLWVLDSLGVLVSAAELGKTMEEKTYAGISGPLTVFSRKAEMLCQKHRCTGIGINQIRDDLGAMWAGAIKTPGGKAWKHCTSMRIQFSRGSFIDDKGNEIKRSSEHPVGNIVMAAIIKTKVCPPDRRITSYTLNYRTGVDYISDLVNVAVSLDCIQKSGAWYSILNPETGEEFATVQGMSRVYEYLDNEDNVEALKQIETFVEQKIKEI